MKRFISSKLIVTMLTSLILCMGQGIAQAKTDIPDGEDTHVRLAVSYSGHVLAAIAEDMGFTKDEGIEVEFVTLLGDEEAFASLTARKVDILSSYGTNGPLRYIAEGGPVSVFAGFMLSGAMPIVTRNDMEWKGVESLIGKKVAGNPGQYAVSGPLMDKGYDAVNDVEWVNISSDMDKLVAIKTGNADYGIIGTGHLATAQKMGLKIVCYLDEVLPDYSCCRAICHTDWIQKNPHAAKALLKSWIRAQEVYERDKAYATRITARQIEADEDYVKVYMLNPHYIINVNPNRVATRRAWNYLDRLGVLGKNGQKVNVDDHINTQVYKAALDECIAEHYDSDPAFYDRQLANFKAMN